MDRYPFLSDDWVKESRRIREEYRDQVPEVALSIRMNQIIKEVPFEPGEIHAYIDTSSGQLEIDTGHLDSPDVTVTLGYATAKAILVDGDAQVVMNAFMSGRIKVDGDITKLIAFQTSGGGPGANSAAVEMVERIQAITAPD